MIFFINLIACNKSNEELKEEDVVVENENNGEDTGDKEDVIEETPSCTVNSGSLSTTEGATLEAGYTTSATREFCTGILHPFFGAIDSTFSIQATLAHRITIDTT